MAQTVIKDVGGDTMKKLAVALILAVCLVKAAHPADNDKRTYIFAAGVPDGIVAVLWDGSPIPPIKKAMAAGIPVVIIEANLPNSGAMSFIGLDNYQAGADTAKELIKLGGD
jgi:ABC-type sugar transport system substrate-binding protein